MRVWREGFQEVARQLRRLKAKLDLWREEKRLAKAETELGMLGWQQAEFLVPELQEQVSRIMDFEKDQAVLFNREAVLSDRAENIKSETQREREAAAADLAAFQSSRRELLQSQRAANKQLLDFNQITAGLRQQVLRTQSEMDQLALLERKLSSVDTTEAREEMIRVYSERSQLDATLTELQAQIAGRAAGEDELLAEVTKMDAALSTVDAKIAARERHLQQRVEEFQEGIRELEEEKRRVRQMADDLEHQKTTPMRAIGACLADSNIPPMNQPHALDQVHAIRERMAALRQRIKEAERGSARADRQVLQSFYLYAAVGLFALVGLLLHFIT